MKLNPCPFCSNSKIKYSTKKSGSYKAEYYQAAFYCDACHAYGPRVLSQKFDGKYSSGYSIRRDENLKIEASKLWNQQSQIIAVVKAFSSRLNAIYSDKVYEPTEKQPVRHTMIPVLLDRIDEIESELVKDFE